MPSGKQSRRRRQETQRKPPPVKGARRAGVRRQANPKLLLAVGGGVLAIVAVVVVVVLVTRGGSNSTPPAPLPGAASVEKLFSNIPQAGNRLGNPAAPVTMVEYVDLQCPICKAFEEQLLPGVLRKYVRTGKVQIESRPITIIGPDSANGQLGAIAAARQNRMFPYTQLLYLNQGTENTGWLTPDEAERAAVALGLDLNQFKDDFNSSEARSQAQTYTTQASQDGVRGTPTVLVGKTGGKLVIVPAGQVEAAIARELK
jgi:protein-disulfide isomerase